MERNPEFPEVLSCMGMPSVDGLTVELRVISEDEQPSQDFTVSKKDVSWVNMPLPPPPELIDTPEKALIVEAVRPLLERQGLALVACRVVERHPGYLIVEVPATAGASRITVKPENLARPYRHS